MLNRLLFTFLILALPAYAGLNTDSDLVRLGKLGDGPMCDEYFQDMFRSRTKQEKEFLFEQQEVHRHFPETTAMRSKDEAYLYDLQNSRMQACVDRPQADQMIRNAHAKENEPDDNMCGSFEMSLDILGMVHEKLVGIDKKLWNDFYRLIEKDSELHAEHKKIVQGLKEKAGPLYLRLANEMMQVYFHSLGTVSRPILQAMAWESERLDNEGYSLELKLAKLRDRREKCTPDGTIAKAAPESQKPRTKGRPSPDKIDIINPTGGDKNSAYKAKSGGKGDSAAAKAFYGDGKNSKLSGMFSGDKNSKLSNMFSGSNESMAAFGKRVGTRGISADDTYFQDPEVKQKKQSVQLYRYVKHR